MCTRFVVCRIKIIIKAQKIIKYQFQAYYPNNKVYIIDFNLGLPRFATRERYIKITIFSVKLYSYMIILCESSGNMTEPHLKSNNF